MNTKFLQYGFWSLILSVTAHAQLATAQSIARTAYFMENATHRHLMNPALTPSQGYLSLPMLGAFSLGIESNMQFTNFVYPALTSNDKPRFFLDQTVDAADFLSNMKPNNFLRMDLRTSILSLGFYSNTGFWSFDIANRFNMNMNLPYDLFAFAKLGMAHTTGDTYNLANLSFGAYDYTEVALGYSRNIMNNLRVGAKIKYLGGGGYLQANIKTMDIDMKPEVWTVTSEGEMNAYGKGLILEKDEEGTINGVDMDSPGLGGAGMALDLGATYSPIQNLDVSLGIIDLGGIKWKKENGKKAGSSGTTTFTGLSGINTDSNNSDNMEDQLTDLKDDLTAMADFKEKAVTDGFYQKLSPTVNAGAEYSLLNNKLSVGALYTVRMMEDENFSELTGSVNLRPSKWFNLSGSYSSIHGEMETFGWAIGFVPGIINLFMACDYTFLKYSPQYIPLHTFNTNFQFGVSIPLGNGHLPDKY